MRAISATSSLPPRPGHHDVADDQIDAATETMDLLDAFDAIARLEQGVPKLHQCAAEERTDVVVVFHDENRLGNLPDLQRFDDG